MMKRAQHLQMEVLIVAVLLLAAVGIILAIVLRGGETLTKSTTTCEGNKGTCVESTAACIRQGGTPMEFDCPTKEKPACCKT